jgi:hypothetical protein
MPGKQMAGTHEKLDRAGQEHGSGNVMSALPIGDEPPFPALAPRTLETQSSVNFAVGAVPDVMRQSLSEAATFRIRIVPNDSSVPMTSALTVAAR